MKTRVMLAFILGAVAGSYGTYLYLKDRFAKIAQEEIDSVKEVYGKKSQGDISENVSEEEKTEEVERTYTELNKAKDISEAAGYVSYDEVSKKKTSKKKKKDKINYIPSTEYGTEDDYDLVSYTHYADGYITDELDEVIENPEEHLGAYWDHFDDFDDNNTVYIKNDTMKIYYEILKDDGCFMEENMPFDRED